MPLFSSDFLRQARHLALREPKRPKQASLRRCISTSYYALFHFLIEESTRLVIGTNPRLAPLRHLAGRAFVHGKMKSLCELVQKSTANHKLFASLRTPFLMKPDADLQSVAHAFVELQAYRHRADYDMSGTFTRAQALQAADQADDSMKCWKSLRTENPDLALLFAVCLLLWPSLGSH